jgi:hypothetical protein
MTNLLALPVGTVLGEDYRIERVLGAGGFGITYLAHDRPLARKVTIKEYFPIDFAARDGDIEAHPRSRDCSEDYQWGLDRFIAEAQTLARLQHPHIVQVHRYFRANNTGYIVLKFEEGKSLKAWLKELGRAPRQAELDALVVPLLDALEVIHEADFLHRDIAPDNIMVRSSGEPVLIDFGSARGDIARQSRTLSALVKPGYSPYEQYATTSSRQGPWTDIYSLGATLYHAVCGKRPTDAPTRMVADELVPATDAALSSYRKGFLAAIDRALRLEPGERPQSVSVWRRELLAPDPKKARSRLADMMQAGLGGDRVTPPPAPDARPAASTEAAAKQPAGPGAPTAAGPIPAASVAAMAPSPQPSATAHGLHGHDARVLADASDREGRESVLPLRDTPREPGTAAIRHHGLGHGPAPLANPSPNPARSSVSGAPPARRPAEPIAPPTTSATSSPAGAGKVRTPPRPRAEPGARWRRLRPLAWKLGIGAVLATGFVAFQDRIPRFEVQGFSVPTSDTARKIEVATLPGHLEGAVAARFAGDGTTLVSLGGDGTLRLWNAQTGTPVRTLRVEPGRATALAVEGSRAAVAFNDGRIDVLELGRGERLLRLKRNEAPVWSLAWLGGGQRLLAATHDWKVVVWDLKGGSSEPAEVLDDHTNAVQALAVSADGAHFATGGADRAVRLWDAGELRSQRRYRGHREFVSAVAFSPDGRTLAAAALDGRVRLWSTRSSRLQRSFEAGEAKLHAVLALSGEGGARLATADDEGKIKLWRLSDGRLLHTLTGHAGAVKGLAASADGRRLASASADGTVRLWDLGRLAGAPRRR